MIACYFLFLIVILTNGETQHDAANYARHLVSTEIKGSFATFFHQNDMPLASLADFSESCALDGHLIFVMADVSVVAKNLQKNPMGSFLLSETNCSISDYGNFPYDPLACARVSFNGKFEKLESSLDSQNLDYLAFVEKHPAVLDWLSVSSPHQFHLWKLDIQKIHYIGGYGHLHYIGDIDVNVYLQSHSIQQTTYSQETSYLDEFLNEFRRRYGNKGH